jgi:hypothetical protein
MVPLTETLKIAVLCLGGLALIGGAGYLGAENAHFKSITRTTQGIVVDEVSRRGARCARLYHAVVRFRPANESQDIEFRADPGLWPGLFAVGEPVTVRYVAHAPTRARIDSFWIFWFLPAVMLAFGLACGAAGLHIWHARAWATTD